MKFIEKISLYLWTVVAALFTLCLSILIHTGTEIDKSFRDPQLLNNEIAINLLAESGNYDHSELYYIQRSFDNEDGVKWEILQSLKEYRYWKLTIDNDDIQMYACYVYNDEGQWELIRYGSVMEVEQ